MVEVGVLQLYNHNLFLPHFFFEISLFFQIFLRSLKCNHYDH
nr:MAG TPA: hypothetical protein [Caudoviricetes sp.]